ncbi:MAG: carboxypeptidase-like regulatory domain-containing protein, partial [Dysgonamonadaceae bacterium]|nr:carboxypeptidase-like regulatory domain-containing protein [Dysgonamonadaceae bacterium]
MKQKSVFLSVILFLLSAGNVFAQKLQGRVTDKRGEPLIGATVVVVASTNGTTTDLDGNYSLAVPAG